jgi:lysozyme
MNLGLALEIATILAKRWEGLFLSPYLCPAGVPTIGYGTTYYEDGTRVTLLDPDITKDRALALLVMQLQNVYLPQVLALCPGLDSAERVAAILDFTYNLGGSNLRHSNLRKRINAGDWGSVPAELMKWVKGGGKVLPGLTKRRAAEAILIN